MRLLVPLLALALGGASSFLVACGDRNGLLPATKAAAMIRALGSVSDAVGAGNCKAAERDVSRARNVLHSATTSRPTLTDRLRLELDHLAAVASTQCQPTTATTTTTTSTPSTETRTTTPTTTSATSQTTDTTTSTNTSTDITPSTDTGQTNGGATPGRNGHGRGHGNGNGTGNGGGNAGG